MEKLLPLRKIILLAGIVWTAALLALYLILGESPEKVTLLVVTLVCPALVYGFIRLDFLIVRKNASDTIMTIASYFFICAGVIALVMGLLPVITDFPDGYSPLFPVGVALIVGVLDDRHKHPPIQP